MRVYITMVYELASTTEGQSAPRGKAHDEGGTGRIWDA